MFFTFTTVGNFVITIQFGFLASLREKVLLSDYHAAPCWRTDEWQTTEIWHLRSKEKRRTVPSCISAGRTILNKSIWAFLKIILDNNCTFPSSRLENDRLHTNRLKIAKWPKAVFFFKLSLSFYRQSPSAKQPPSFCEQNNQDKGSKIRREKRRCRKEPSESRNLAKRVILSVESSARGRFHFFHHLKKNNYYLSISKNIHPNICRRCNIVNWHISWII